MNEKFARMDIGVFAAALVMLGFGLVLVYSSSFAVAQRQYQSADYFLERQIVRALIALVCFVVFINIDYHVWGKLSAMGFIAAVVLLLAVLALPESYAINGAKRWITFGSVRFQVSEFARMAMVMVVAARCDRIGEEIREWRGILPSIAKVVLLAVLIFLEPDFSTAVIVTVMGFTLLFVAGARFWHMTAIALSALPFFAIGLLRTPYRRRRLLGFMDASEHAQGVGYQISQSLIGLGNGGTFGVGLGQGSQKYFYLPEPHTDFAFSILGEEIGFVGLLLVMAVFGFIVYRGIRIALEAPDRMGQLIAFGLTFTLAIYVIMHASVNVGLVPTTGVPLPFLSYGGMSLILTMSAVGILLNISSQTSRVTNATVQRQRERLSKYRP